MSGEVEQVLVMHTYGRGMRSEAFGWTAEDPRNVRRDKPVGYSLSWDHRREGAYTYDTPLHALAAGWRMLAPPEQFDGDNHEWWFVRTVQP
jgi:hypothetical protein